MQVLSVLDIVILFSPITLPKSSQKHIFERLNERKYALISSLIVYFF